MANNAFRPSTECLRNVNRVHSSQPILLFVISSEHVAIAGGQYGWKPTGTTRKECDLRDLVIPPLRQTNAYSTAVHKKMIA